MIFDWAALDPATARAWADNHDLLETPNGLRSFILGWYENDRAAAVAYFLAHPDNPPPDETGIGLQNRPPGESIAGEILYKLYLDTKDGAREFIAQLPDDTRRVAAFHGAFRSSLYEEEEMGEPKLAPEAVRDWMVQFPPAYWKGTLQLVFESINKPTEEAINWIEQQALEIRDAVAAEYEPPDSRPISQTLPAILRVADSRLRDQLLTALFKNSGYVPQDLDNTLAAAAISTELKNHVRDILAQVYGHTQ